MSEDSCLKFPVFEGTQKAYMIWWVRLSAYAVMKNFARALKVDASLPSKESDVAATEEAKLAKKANEVAMASLTMAF